MSKIYSKNPNDKELEIPFTMTPNFCLDTMAMRKPAENCVYFAIVRQTVGYLTPHGSRKKSAPLSISRLMQLTGLSRQGVLNSRKSLFRDGWILFKRGEGMTSYAIVDRYEEFKRIQESTELTDDSQLSRLYQSTELTDDSQLSRQIKEKEIKSIKKEKETEKLTSSKFIEYKNRLRTIDEKFNLSYLESSKANQYYEQAQKKYEELNSNKSFAEFFESILTKLEKLTSQKLDRFAFKQGFTIESLVKFDLQGCAKVEAWYNDCYPSGYSSQNSQYQGYDKEQLKKEGWIV